MLQNYCRNISNEYAMKICVVNKLVQNLGNQCTYAIHYKNLPLYLSLGMKLVEVHKILKFKQLNKHIHFNTDKSKNVANSFEIGFLFNGLILVVLAK